MNWFGILAMAQPQQGAGADAGQSGAFMFIWLGLMVALFYFMLIRPQKRREKERQELLSAVKTGDRVLFADAALQVNRGDRIGLVRAVSSVFSDEKKLSIAALSQQLPERLMLQATPCSVSNRWNGSLVYWLPRSE